MHLLTSSSHVPAQRVSTRPPSGVLHGDGSRLSQVAPAQPGSHKQCVIGRAVGLVVVVVVVLLLMMTWGLPWPEHASRVASRLRSG